MSKKVLLIFLVISSSSYLAFGQKRLEEKIPIDVKKSFFDLNYKISQIESPSYLKDKIPYQSLQFAQIKLTIQQKLPKIRSTSFTYFQSPEKIKSMDFEGLFPNPSETWYAFDGDDTFFGEYFWGTVDSFYHLTPTHSAWCAAAGQSANPNSRIYPNNCNSWLVCGPLNLEASNWASVKYSLWLDSQPDHDYLCCLASIDGYNFSGYGISGDSEGWLRLNFNLTNVPELGNITGKPNVWIAFLFFSDDDSTEAFEGAYLDDISIETAVLKEFQIVQPFPAPTSDGTGITVDDKNFWYADWKTAKLYQLDKNNPGIILREEPSPDSLPTGLTNDDHYLWNADLNGKIYSLDKSNLKKVDEIVLDGKFPFGLTNDDRDLWVSDYYQQCLYRLNQFSGRIDKIPFTDDMTSRLTGLAWNEPFLWLADESNSIIYKLDQSGFVHDYFLSPAPFPRGLTYYNDHLWCVANDTIFQLLIKDDSELKVIVEGYNCQKFPEITAYLSVMDINDNPIRKLAQENFSTFENGYIQDILQFSQLIYNHPMSFALVIDRSSSMDYDTTLMRGGAHFFINLMRLKDKGAIFKFAGNIHKYQELTSDTQKLHRAIDSSFVDLDRSRFYDATYQAIDEIKNESLPKFIITLSDGSNKGSVRTKEEVIQQALAKEVKIFCIGLGGEIDSGEVNLEEISGRTKGKYYKAKNENTLDWIFEEIYSEIIQEYQIIYNTNRPARDGSFRNVLISVGDNSKSGYGFFQYQAPSKDTIKIWIENISVNSGDLIKIPVYVEDVSNRDIRAVFIEINFNSLIANATGGVRAGIIPSGWNLTSNVSIPGKITIAAAGTMPLVGTQTDNDTLITLFFQVTGKSGESTQLHFNNPYFNEGFPYVNPIDGLLTILDGFSISGYLKYYPVLNESDIASFDKIFTTKKAYDSLFANSSSKNMPEVQLEAKNSNSCTTTTNDSGFYRFEKLPKGRYSITPNKANEANNAITPFDASNVLQYVVGLRNLSPYQKLAANVTGDTTVSALDASEILRYCVGLINEFPVNADWTFVPHDVIIKSTEWHKLPRYREYNELTQSQNSQNFYGILYGDVTGNWIDSTSAVPKNFNPDLSFDYSATFDGSEVTNKNVNIILHLNESFDINSFGFTIKYDPDIIKKIQITPTKNTQDFLLLSNAEHGLIKIAAASANAIQGKCSLIILEVSANNKIQSNRDNSIIISELSLNEHHARNLNKAIQLNLATTIPIECSISQNYPNPFNMKTMIKYQLPEKALVKIEIFNLLGQRVRFLVNEEMKAGYHQTFWDGSDEFQNILPSGVYIFRFKANQFAINRKMVMLR